jgi:hypothetical protein
VSTVENICTGQAMLDHLDSRVSEKITEIAGALRDLVSIRIAVGVPPGEAQLIFGKLDGEWCFCYDDGYATPVPLLSAPRDVRAKMLTDGHIERLIDNVTAQIAINLAQREGALKAADTVLAKLRAVKR